MAISDNLPDIATAPLESHISIYSMLSSADIVSKIVMLILVLASVYSWAVIFDKIIFLRRLKKKILQFENLFWSGQALDRLYESTKRSSDNPLSVIFVSAMDECKHKAGKSNNDSFLKISQKDRMVQGMYLIRDREVEKMEKNLDFLAIIGSNALFVGLFGTVWGIMHSFQSIAASKNTTLAVVAPGIAEALLATAIGLITAVPCVIFYSYLTSKVIGISNKIEDFIGELNSMLSRAIDEEKL